MLCSRVEQVELGKLRFSCTLSFFSVNIPGAWWGIRQNCTIHQVNFIYSNHISIMKWNSCGVSAKTVFYSQKLFYFIFEKWILLVFFTPSLSKYIGSTTASSIRSAICRKTPWMNYSVIWEMAVNFHLFVLSKKK